MTGLSASVVIPARNARHSLDACLAALDADRASFREVIVVDDGSSDGTAEVALAHGAVVIRAESIGPGAARNAGAAAAMGDVLIFFDADCVPRPGTVQALLEPLARDPGLAGVRGGYTTDQRGVVPRFVQLEFDEKQDRLARTAEVTVVDTACAAYRRAVFMRCSGFDEQFRAPTAEDVELSFRLAAEGQRLAYAPGALVAHRHPRRLPRYCWRKLRFGYFRAGLYRRFPERMVGDGYTPRSMPIQIGFVGLLLASLAASAWKPGLLWLAALAAAGFLSATVPLVRRAWRSDRGLTALVPALVFLRAACQGVGLAAGFASLLRLGGRARVRVKPAVQGPG